MQHHRKLTQTDRRQIIAARAEGVPAIALARRFGVSRRAIYDTLRRSRPEDVPSIQTVSVRISERSLTNFDAALARRGITDRPAALRHLLAAGDRLLPAPDPDLSRTLAGWITEIRRQGATINLIAKQLNEARLRGEPLPPIARGDTAFRDLARYVLALANDLDATWRAKTGALAQEVDKVLDALRADG